MGRPYTNEISRAATFSLFAFFLLLYLFLFCVNQYFVPSFTCMLYDVVVVVVLFKKLLNNGFC